MAKYSVFGAAHRDLLQSVHRFVESVLCDANRDLFQSIHRLVESMLCDVVIPQAFEKQFNESTQYVGSALHRCTCNE